MTEHGERRERLTLSELVEETGVPASTIHHYRRAGLIPAPERPAPNRFCYDRSHVESLRLIRRLREHRGLSLEAIGVMLPALLQDPPGTEAAGGHPDVRVRIIDAATVAFRTQSYGEVTVGDVAEAAGVAKGRVYRYFASKEDLFDAVVECIMAGTAIRFAAAVDELGGADGVAGDPERTAVVFARLVADAMPILLELGARAAKGHEPSGDQARRVLRTLAQAAGRPLTPGAAEEEALKRGLAVIERAFATVIAWAVTPDWSITAAGGTVSETGA